VATITSLAGPPSSGSVARQQAVEMNLLRTDAVERREPPHQHEILAAIGQRLLDHDLIGRRFDHAEQRRVALWIAAGSADFEFGEGIAARAMADAIDGPAQRVAKLARAFAVVLQQVIRHALGRLRSNAGQHLERLDQRLQRGGRRRSHDRAAWSERVIRMAA
jgi:hypothetical protein